MECCQISRERQKVIWSAARLAESGRKRFRERQISRERQKEIWRADRFAERQREADEI